MTAWNPGLWGLQPQEQRAWRAGWLSQARSLARTLAPPLIPQTPPLGPALSFPRLWSAGVASVFIRSETIPAHLESLVIVKGREGNPV